MSQDTFAFALVLLCLAVGDISYVRKQGRCISTTAFATGWRPKLPESLRRGCPEIAALIEDMWLTDFRARPAIKDVVARLETCVVVEIVSIVADPSLDYEHSSVEGLLPTLPELIQVSGREQQLELENAELKDRIRILEIAMM